MNTDSIVAVSKKQIAQRWIENWLLVVLVVLIPFIVHTVISFVFGRHNEWHIDMIAQSISNGTLWITPAHAIFQVGMYTIGHDEQILGIFVLLMVLAVALLVLLMIKIIMIVVHSLVRTAFRSTAIKRYKEHLGTKPLFIHSIFGKIELGALAMETDKNIQLAIVGGNAIFSMKTSAKLPNCYIDSRQNNLARREGVSIVPPRIQEVVLDGTMFELFKLYLPQADHQVAPQLFNSDVVATLVKNLSNCEVIIEGGNIYIIISLTDTTIPSSVDLLLTSIHELDKKFTSAVNNKKLVLSNDNIIFGTASYVTLPFGFYLRRRTYYIVWLLISLPTILLFLIVPKWTNLSDIMLLTTIISCAAIIPAWQLRIHRTCRSGGVK